MTKVLIVYGSKRGGTAGIADMVANAMKTSGVTVDVLAAETPTNVSQYDAVIIGGGIYAGNWHEAAYLFTSQHQDELLSRPIWLFSSGPLDDSASDGAMPLQEQVKSVLNRLKAQGHMTFGGYFPEGAQGLPAEAVAKTQPGDWRDPDQISRWATSITRVLAEQPATGQPLGGQR